MPVLSPTSNSIAVQSGVAEATLTSATSTLPTPLLLILGALSFLYLFGPPILRWRFPCQTAEELNRLINNLQILIDSNSRLEQDVIELCRAEEFKSTLDKLSAQVYTIQLRWEPRRTNPFVWAMFWWKVIRDVDECYEIFRELDNKAMIYDAQTAGPDADESEQLVFMF
ncbi:hypothetical protein Moror_2594 [Moniliophthora roreri MCA 2997]|uniref:Uncharacterized protein n=1 Tax=Moniliophthora roreri (strain MCA 2997) TaxID=1381753 RepID=V2XGA9_MONRO|nr:hypothetical protein Moror_2594 [Moniliophthora roreri MCA 2997]